MIDWYDAVVNATPGDMSVARRSFIAHWGKEAYDVYIRKYAEALTPRYLVYAPRTKYLIWTYDFLARRYAEHRGEAFQVPDWWVFELEPDPLIPCTHCGGMTSEKSQFSGERFNIQGPICGICWTLLETQAADTEIARMWESVNQQLEEIQAAKVTLAQK